MDDGRLSRTLCEEKIDEEVENIINEECCACEEAKYEVMFQVNQISCSIDRCTVCLPGSLE